MLNNTNIKILFLLLQFYYIPTILIKKNTGISLDSDSKKVSQTFKF